VSHGGSPSTWWLAVVVVAADDAVTFLERVVQALKNGLDSMLAKASGDGGGDNLKDLSVLLAPGPPVVPGSTKSEVTIDFKFALQGIAAAAIVP
jgi:hypothetical protein